MSVIYNTNTATTDLQEVGNLTLDQILQQLVTLSGGANEQDEVNKLTQILTALGSLATSANQSTAQTTLSSILSALSGIATATKQDTGNTSLASIVTALASQATASKQDTGNTSLASIVTALAAQATAAKQDTGNTALASILSAVATAAKQDIGNASLASIDAKIGSSTGTITQVSQLATSAVALAANANRKGFYLYNNSGQKAYVAFAATASTSAFTILVAANSGYESSQAAVYRGVVSVMFMAAGSGNMQVTEMT